MEWKTALYDFMHNRNETELDFNLAHAAANVSDERFLEAERLRQARRQELSRERGLTPLRCKTRLRLHSASLQEGIVWADVEWHRMLEYRLKTRIHREEQLVGERIGLARQNGRWLVRQVEQAHPDGALPRNPAFGETQLPGPASPHQEPDRRRPSPYLNREFVSPPEAEDEIRRIPYNRERAKQYADLWWNSANPEYIQFEVDCSNFVSQCLFAGGAPMDYTGKRESGWWYRGKSGSKELWSYSWAVANSLRLHLAASRRGLRAERVDLPEQLAVGDVISYSFDGSGRFGHSTIVTAFDGNGMPLVNAHTVNCRRRYWDYKDSYAWTERTMYRFFHIPDEL